jgi:D-serine deaminase-like pyridoxal phosphate-dependent protein|nr:alanine racemase [Candidatus Krumholzibacteria bacterium]
MENFLKKTSRQLGELGLISPAVVLDEQRVRNNIRRMADKAAAAQVRFRPHFKTHQSGAVGQWFREADTSAITVSSLPMAEYFAEFGWNDITLAFLLNPRELPRLGELAEYLDQKKGRLGVTIDAVATALQLVEANLPVHIWLKIDTGYGRTGIPWDHAALLRDVAGALGPHHSPTGLLSHTGDSYAAHGVPDLQAHWDAAVERLTLARSVVPTTRRLDLSLGDTPCCATVPTFEGVDEVRPGNFVFFDLMQREIGACQDKDLAVAVACPVVGMYPDQGRLVLHGGAVHLAKEHLRFDGQNTYGCLGTLDPSGRAMGQVLSHLPITGLSQEHGIVQVEPEVFRRELAELEIGDLVLVWPVHSCLSCDLHRQYHTLDGQVLARR